MKVFSRIVRRFKLIVLKLQPRSILKPKSRPKRKSEYSTGSRPVKPRHKPKFSKMPGLPPTVTHNHSRTNGHLSPPQISASQTVTHPSFHRFIYDSPFSQSIFAPLFRLDIRVSTVDPSDSMLSPHECTQRKLGFYDENGICAGWDEVSVPARFEEMRERWMRADGGVCVEFWEETGMGDTEWWTEVRPAESW